MVYEDLHVSMPLVSAVRTDRLPCQMREEAEETVDDVNVALELGFSPGPLMRDGEIKWKRKH